MEHRFDSGFGFQEAIEDFGPDYLHRRVLRNIAPFAFGAEPINNNCPVFTGY